MLFKLLNRYKFVAPTAYFLIFIVLLSFLSWLFYKQTTCVEVAVCAISKINPSSYLMPVIAYLSIGLVGVTIGFTRKTASEKNALDFVKDMEEQREHLKELYAFRQKTLLQNGKLDRRKASAYMEALCHEAPGPVSAPGASKQPSPTQEEVASTAATSERGGFLFAWISQSGKEQEKQDAGFFLCLSSAPSEPSEVVPAEAPPKEDPDAKMRASAAAILNSMEKCANAIRYGIYDEDFIYNIYGSHFIELYELTYGYIKARQLKQARIWVNFEWLAVKWTLRRNITGVISKESIDTSYVINESLDALKEHNKTRPVIRKLKRFEAKLERRKFPM